MGVFGGRRTGLIGAASALALVAGLGGGVVPGIAQQGAQTLRMTNNPQQLTGRLQNGDRLLSGGEFADDYSFRGRRGQVVAIAMVSPDVDPYLLLGGPNGFQQQNDDRESGNSSAFLEVTLPADGEYRLTATSYAAGESGEYTLVYGAEGPGITPTLPPPPARPQPSPPPPVAQAGGSMTPGSSRNGNLAQGDQQLQSGEYLDRYTFEARAGQRYVVEMLSSQFDPYLGVNGPGGFSQEIDDGGEGVNSRLEFEAPSSGTYTIVATSLQPRETGAYTVRLNAAGGGSSQPQPFAGGGGGSGGSGASGGTVQPGQTVRGNLASGDQTLGSGEFVDNWTLQARQGEQFDIQLSSSDFDSYLMVRGPGGLSQDNDDDSARQGTTNSRIVFTAAADGPVTVAATSFRSGETGNYSLQVGRAGAGAVAPPPPPMAATGPALQLGAAPTRGSLAQGDQTLNSGEFMDTYSVQLRRGQTVTAELDSSAFDAYLIAFGPGDVRVDNDDGPGAGTNARATFTAAQDGTYFIRATSFRSGETGPYTVRVRAGSGGGTATAGQSSTPTPAGAQLQAGRQVTGSLAASDARSQGGQYVDRYAFQGRAGQRVILNMASTGFDTVVTLVSPSGARETNDDIASGNTNSRLETTLASDGVYTVEASSFQTNTTGSYTLSLATPSGQTTPTPRPQQQTGGSGSGLALGRSVSGRLDASDTRLDDGQYFDSYSYRGRAGQTITVDVASADFDTQVIVAGPNGQGDSNDDGPDGTNSRLVYTLPQDGEYAIGVTSYASGETGAYQLRITEGTPQINAASGGRVYGVFVGVSQYPNPSDNLNDTDEDAIKLADSLRRNGILAPESVVLTNAQATRANIMSAIRRVGAMAGPQDTFIVFYSGHGSKTRGTSGGVPEPDGQDETLAVYDGEILDNEMGDAFASLNARVAILALDSCFSGGFARDVVNRPNVMGLFSSEEDLTSQVADKFEAGGYLSHFLRIGLAGEADENRDRAVSAGELSAFLRRRFAEEGDIGAVTADRQRNYQYLVVERGGVKIDDILVFTGNSTGRG